MFWDEVEDNKMFYKNKGFIETTKHTLFETNVEQN